MFEIKEEILSVLILVFVEFTLRELNYNHMEKNLNVLILVFVEFTLRDKEKNMKNLKELKS